MSEGDEEWEDEEDLMEEEMMDNEKGKTEFKLN
jgi:hypothetical protein